MFLAQVSSGFLLFAVVDKQSNQWTGSEQLRHYSHDTHCQPTEVRTHPRERDAWPDGWIQTIAETAPETATAGWLTDPPPPPSLSAVSLYVSHDMKEKKLLNILFIVVNHRSWFKIYAYMIRAVCLISYLNEFLIILSGFRRLGNYRLPLMCSMCEGQCVCFLVKLAIDLF